MKLIKHVIKNKHNDVVSMFIQPSNKPVAMFKSIKGGDSSSAMIIPSSGVLEAFVELGDYKISFNGKMSDEIVTVADPKKTIKKKK